MLRFDIFVFDQIKMFFICENHLHSIKNTILQQLTVIIKYSLTIDAWTNQFAQSFLKITVYFIDDEWKYRELLLNFKSLLSNHTDWKMINVIIKFFEKYNIEFRLLTFTVDSIRFNDTLRFHLKSFLYQQFDFDWDHRQNIIRCMIHVIQLVLNAIFKTFKINDEKLNEAFSNLALIKSIKIIIFWNNTIAKIKSIITFIYHTIDVLQIRFTIKTVRKSFINAHKFQYTNLKNSKHLILMQDVLIRWNNQYDMLFRFLNMKFAITWWIQRESLTYETLKLNDTKWNQMKYLLQFLKFIKNVTNYLSQIKIITVHKM